MSATEVPINRPHFGQAYVWSLMTAGVVISLVSIFYLPFGKLFHVIQRPASIGVELYQRRAREMPQATCPRCGVEFVAELWLGDLKTVVDKLGFDYTMEDGKVWQDYCPRCKRVLRGIAYSSLSQHEESVFRGSRIKKG